MVILINSASGNDHKYVNKERIDYDKVFEEIEWKTKRMYSEDVPDEYKDQYAYEYLDKNYYRYAEVTTLMGLQKVINKVGSIIINPRDENTNGMIEHAIGQKIDLEITIYDDWIE